MGLACMRSRCTRKQRRDWWSFVDSISTDCLPGKDHNLPLDKLSVVWPQNIENLIESTSVSFRFVFCVCVGIRIRWWRVRFVCNQWAVKEFELNDNLDGIWPPMVVLRQRSNSAVCEYAFHGVFSEKSGGRVIVRATKQPQHKNTMEPLKRPTLFRVVRLSISNFTPWKGCELWAILVMRHGKIICAFPYWSRCWSGPTLCFCGAAD